MDRENYIRIPASDPRDSPEGQVILGFRGQLETMRDLFSYGLDFRNITKRNIDSWDRELREIVKGIKKLRNAPRINELLVSCDAVEEMIWSVIRNLYVASDILQKKIMTIKDKQILYQKFRECPGFLSEAIDQYFLI
jgi:hypothetical protein